MKNLSVIFILLVFSICLFAQPGPRGKEKLKQLEKIKLIEILNMDEQTTLRFFARRNEMQEELNKLEEEGDKILSEMENLLKENPVDEAKLAENIKAWQEIRSKIHSVKHNFIESLDDILTTEQIAKLIVFEKQFKEELRRVLIKNRKRKFDR